MGQPRLWEAGVALLDLMSCHAVEQERNRGGMVVVYERSIGYGSIPMKIPFLGE